MINSIFINNMNPMKNLSNIIGTLFEDKIHHNLCMIPNTIKIYREKDLTRMYGWDASSIDFIVEFKENIIFIQTKWRKSRRRESHGVIHFMNSIKHIQNTEPKNNKKYSGLWISRRKPFDDNIRLMKDSGIETLYCFESMEGLVEKATKYISKENN